MNASPEALERTPPALGIVDFVRTARAAFRALF